MRFDAFTSGFYSFPSLDAASQAAMNYYPDLVEWAAPSSANPGGAEKARKVLSPTPGLSLYGTLPTGPIRGLWAGENRLFAAAGSFLYEVLGPSSFTSHGLIGNDGNPVQIISNGDQLFVVSAGLAYCDNGAGAQVCQFSSQLYDLQIDAATGGLTGDTGGIFNSTDVGMTVQITNAGLPPSGSGAAFTIQSQVITSVNSQGEAFGAASWGVAGSMEGTGVEWLGAPLALTGLSITAGGGLSGYTFTSADVGCLMQITGGAGFTVASQTITSVVGGVAFGNSDWGSNGSTGGAGTLWQGQTLAAANGAFLDSSCFAAQPGSKLVYYSAINDATSWDPLNFFSKEAYPDAVAALMADHEQLYIHGALESTEVWASTSSGTNPFQRNPSYFMHYGNGAPYATCRLSAGVAWIGGDVRRGERVAFLALGFVPQRISTAAIEKAWAAYATVQDAVSYTCIMDGHEFWVISFPTGNATWVYDATLGEWHQRGWWNGTGWDRQRGAFHACIGVDTIDEVHYVGDWQNYNLYTMSSAYVEDNGVQIHRRRRASHLCNEKKWRFYSLFELDCDNDDADVPHVHDSRVD